MKNETLRQPIPIPARGLQQRLCFNAIQLREIRIERHRLATNREDSCFQFDKVVGGLGHRSAVLSHANAAQSARKINDVHQMQQTGMRRIELINATVETTAKSGFAAELAVARVRRSSYCRAQRFHQPYGFDAVRAFQYVCFDVRIRSLQYVNKINIISRCEFTW